MARIGVDGVCGGALVDIVVYGVEDTKLDEEKAVAERNALCRAPRQITWPTGRDIRPDCLEPRLLEFGQLALGSTKW